MKKVATTSRGYTMFVTTRIRAGLYTIKTPKGEYTVEHIGSTWYITLPNQRDPDEWTDTLNHAEMIVSAHTHQSN